MCSSVGVIVSCICMTIRCEVAVVIGCVFYTLMYMQVCVQCLLVPVTSFIIHIWIYMHHMSQVDGMYSMYVQ